ncbi:hypothetical protein [Streptomyces halstedii]|uniref:Uncharacterized protein n=1 Tax=Streptomyces halstedii TaxID=1944 RepID=A0A6N9UC71_STRHA|nr:hypothetical protein [Streptomyces halstedii]NEA19753.1 hypothetical protein [Streptomyces halstedii]
MSRMTVSDMNDRLHYSKGSRDRDGNYVQRSVEMVLKPTAQKRAVARSPAGPMGFSNGPVIAASIMVGGAALFAGWDLMQLATSDGGFIQAIRDTHALAEAPENPGEKNDEDGSAQQPSKGGTEKHDERGARARRYAARDLGGEGIVVFSGGELRSPCGSAGSTVASADAPALDFLVHGLDTIRSGGTAPPTDWGARSQTRPDPNAWTARQGQLPSGACRDVFLPR